MPVALLSSLWPILRSLRSGGHDLSILSCFIKKEIRVHPGPGGAEQSWCMGGPSGGTHQRSDGRSDDLSRNRVGRPPAEVSGHAPSRENHRSARLPESTGTHARARAQAGPIPATIPNRHFTQKMNLKTHIHTHTLYMHKNDLTQAWTEAYWFSQTLVAADILTYIDGRINRHGNSQCHLQ